MSDRTPGKGPRASMRRFLEMKREGARIVAMAAHDVLSARMLEGAGVDLVLVGDSLGQVVLDMPFPTYHAGVEDAVRNAGRALGESGGEAVKLEGGSERTVEAMTAVVASEGVALESAGAFAIIPGTLASDLAGGISHGPTIPTIGIGAGPECDGQVVVLHDALGPSPDPPPRFVRRLAELHESADGGIREYARQVREGSFPGPEHSFASG